MITVVQKLVGNLVKKFRVMQDHYIYVARGGTIAPGGSFTDQIQIQNDSSFVLVKLAYFADILGAAQTDATRVVPLIEVSITDTGTGRALQNFSVPISSLAGHEGLPLVLPKSREFKGASTIGVTFTNVSTGVTYNNIRLSMIGYKEFNLGEVAE